MVELFGAGHFALPYVSPPTLIADNGLRISRALAPVECAGYVPSLKVPTSR